MTQLPWPWKVRDTNRMKRGLVDGIGQLSRMLFGTAMNEDVEQLREQYNQITSVASTNNKAIHLNNRNIARLEQHTKDLEKHANLLKISLNDAFAQITTINVLTFVREAIINTRNHSHFTITY